MQRACALGAAWTFPWFWDAKLSSVRRLLRNDGAFGCLSLDRVFCVACGGQRVPLGNGLLYAIWCDWVWPAAAAGGAEHVDGWRKTVTWCEPRLGAVVAGSVCHRPWWRMPAAQGSGPSQCPFSCTAPIYQLLLNVLLLGRDATLFCFFDMGTKSAERTVSTQHATRERAVDMSTAQPLRNLP